jgi:hypothetical protein
MPDATIPLTSGTNNASNGLMFRAALLFTCLASRLVAQSDSASKTLFTARDGELTAAAIVATIAVSHFDPQIARFFTDTTRAHVRKGRRLADVFTHVNETTLTLAGLAAYGAGRLSHSPSLTDVGFHTTEAVFTASVAGQVIRGPLGRSRPRVTNFEDQYDFDWFSGFRHFNNRAFPSIHSSSGFAVATALVQETRLRSPGSVKFVAPLLYVLAATPGLSRMYLGQHWASDVFAGAFMGTLAGLKAVNYSHSHGPSRVERFFMPGQRVEASPGAITLSWSTTF